MEITLLLRSNFPNLFKLGSQANEINSTLTKLKNSSSFKSVIQTISFLIHIQEIIKDCHLLQGSFLQLHVLILDFSYYGPPSPSPALPTTSSPKEMCKDLEMNEKYKYPLILKAWERKKRAESSELRFYPHLLVHIPGSTHLHTYTYTHTHMHAQLLPFQ